VLLFAVSGCAGGSDTPAEPATSPAEPTQSTTEAPTESEAPSPPPRGSYVEDDSAEASAGEVAVTDPAEAAVVDAFVRYTQVRLEAFNRAEVDPAALAEVATGDAMTQVTSYVDRLARRGEHVVGSVVVNVDAVDVEGTRATLDTCMQNSSVDVDESGRVVEKGAPAAYLGRVDAVQVTSDTWVVADVTVDFAEACP
jgi:hypothetical protein